MKRIAILLMVAFCFSISPTFAGNDNAIVRFGDLHGEVNVRPNAEDDDTYIFAELDTPLRHDDRIRTLPKSGAILSFSDMSTFVMKEDSIIVLDIANERDTKIGLVAGNIWVNLKKMVADGSMEIEMSQAVAGLKGTNITCSSKTGEDRIQVLRGVASVMIKATQERLELKEGEELIIKPGGKKEVVPIDVKAVQETWQKDLEKLGDTIELNEIPDVLKGILDSESSEFASIRGTYRNLLSEQRAAPEQVAKLKKDAERFVGVLFEDTIILASMRQKVERAITNSIGDKIAIQKMTSLLKNIADVSAQTQTYQTEIGTIMRAQFKVSAVSEEARSEVELIRSKMAAVLSDVDAVRAIVSTNPNAQVQEWFIESLETCSVAIASLDELSQQVAQLLSEYPANVEVQALLKSITSQRNAIAMLMRSLKVVEIDSATIIELSQIDDTMSDQLVTLQNEITSFNSLAGTTVAEKEKRLVHSVRIMSNFVRVRRQYANAQRLYELIARATSSSKYRTAQMEELKNTYERITDNFQQLGIVADELELNIRDLESQLSTYLD